MKKCNAMPHAMPRAMPYGSQQSPPANYALTSGGFDQSACGEEQAGDTTMIDIVFAMDCTASMGEYIESGKQSIQGIVDEVKKSENSDVRFGYVAYRDHPSQESTFVTMCRDFMKDPSEMKAAIAEFGARGGGDGPEAVTAALKQALGYPWRERAVRIVVLIADAPPHGIGANGDMIPNGDPNGDDPIDIAHKMAKEGVILYVVACEPSLSNYRNAHDLMEGLAQITEGKYLPLTAASLLPAVIVGGVGEEAALKKLEAFVEDTVSEMHKQKKSKEEIEAYLQKHMAEVKTNQVEITDVYGSYDRSNINNICATRNLAEARENIQELVQPQMQMQAQSVSYECKSAPVFKMMHRAMKKGDY